MSRTAGSQDNEDWFHLVADTAPAMLWVGDANGKCVYLNRAQREFWGVDDISIFDWNSTLHPEDALMLSEQFGTAMQTHRAFAVEARYRRVSDGVWRILRTEAQPRFDPSGKFLGMIGVNTDVTGTRQVEASLLAAKERRDLIFALGERQRLLQDPDAIMRMTAGIVGRYMKADRAGFYRVSGTTLTFGPSWVNGTMPALDGTSLDTSTLGDGYNNAARAGISIVSSDTTVPGDVGERAGRLGARAGIASPMLRQGKWTSGIYVSSAVPRQWTPEEVAFVEEIAETSWDNVERAQAEAALREGEARSRAELERLVAERTAELRASEEQLRQAQKMEAIGQLTGGIAHDFNNMLAVVIGGLSLLQRRLERGDTDVGKYVDAAIEGATRAAALTQRLLAFSRQKALAPEPVDPNRMVMGMIELLARTLGEHIHIEPSLADGLWQTNVDPTELESVVLNLSVNARDAMPDGGTLRIQTRNVKVNASQAAEYQVPIGDYVCIVVADTGTGMPPDVVARAFDPFFTTKGVGKGTGLGLSQVFGFIRQSGGHVEIDSKVGDGTTISVLLPRFDGVARTDAAKPLAPGVPSGKPGEIILVVEDEERVRNYSVEALRELGYTVVQAASGPEALRLIEGGHPVTLIFSDMVMPEMRGRELVQRAARSLSNLKVLYTTGYASDAIAGSGALDPGAVILQKPFSIQQLATKIRAVLDS